MRQEQRLWKLAIVSFDLEFQYLNWVAQDKELIRQTGRKEVKALSTGCIVQRILILILNGPLGLKEVSDRKFYK